MKEKNKSAYLSSKMKDFLINFQLKPTTPSHYVCDFFLLLLLHCLKLFGTTEKQRSKYAKRELYHFIKSSLYTIVKVGKPNES